MTTPFRQYKANLRHKATIRKNGGVEDEHQGYSNYDTFQVAVTYDNDQKLYNAVRQLVRNGGDAQALEAWATPAVIAPINKGHLDDAQSWNDVPQEERVDHNYEAFRDKHGDDPKAMDLLHGLIGGPDTEDMDPSGHMINPSLVNWDELLADIQNELAEEDRYNQPQPQQPQPQPPAPAPDAPGDMTLPAGWQ